MDAICIIGGAILLALSGITPEDLKGTVKAFGIVILLVGIIIFIISFKQGYDHATNSFVDKYLQ